MPLTETVGDVLDYLRKTQNGSVDRSEAYISEIAREIDRDKGNIGEIVEFLKKYDIVEVEEDGPRKIVILNAYLTEGCMDSPYR